MMAPLMSHDRRNKDFIGSSDDSPTQRPLYGLLVMGLVAIFFQLMAVGLSGVFSEDKSAKSETGECIYQVFEDHLCLGTVFLAGPESISTILAALGKDVDGPTDGKEEKLPCNSTINFSTQPTRKTVSKISGAILLTMGKPIDLNSADHSDLVAVPGIGPALAQRIITYRESQGPFKQIGDLERIAGIGKKRKDAFGVYLTAGPSN